MAVEIGAARPLRDFRPLLLELFDDLRENDERLLFVTRARCIRREGGEDGPGVLAVTDSSVRFIGLRSDRVRLDRDRVTSATTEYGDPARICLRLSAGSRTTVMYDIPTTDEAALRTLTAGPRAGGEQADTTEGGRENVVAVVAALAAVAAAVALWVNALAGIDPRDIGGLGLVSSLPPAAFVALGLITCSFCATLARGTRSTPLLALHVVALIFMVYGSTTLVEQVPSLNVTWRHAGIARFVMDTGGVDRSIDAYSNWPGFFMVLALATELTGLRDPIQLADWAPLAFNLLYLAPLVAIARSVRADRRLVWASVWIFYCANWVRQDYLSPQALVYLLYLAVLALLLNWFPGGGSAWRPHWPGGSLLARAHARWPNEQAVADAARVPAVRRGALAIACVAIVAAVIPSHQLTPFAILFAAVALVALGQCSLRGLPLIVAVMTAAWVTFFAAPYLTGHLGEVGGQLGNVGGTVSKGVGDRVGGSSDHVTIVALRIAFTALLWGLAAVGAVKWLRGRRDGLALVALALAPLTLVFLQAYGGEILLRAYLFQLPVLALLAGALVVPASKRWQMGVGLAVLSAVLLAGLLFTRFGNDRVLMFTKQEVQGIGRLYAAAPRNSILVAPSNNLAWQEQGYGAYRHLLMNRIFTTREGTTPQALAARLANYLAGRPAPAAFLIITRSVRNYDAEFGSSPWGKVTDLERGVGRSPRFQLVYANPDVKVFRFVRRPGGGP